MTAASALIRGRRAAEGLMVDTCTIVRTAETPMVWNEDTMAYEPDEPAFGADSYGMGLYGGSPQGAPIYQGPCRVQLSAAMANTPEAGERVLVVQRATVSVPIAVTGVAVGDTVTITAAEHDPDLAGNTYRVRSLFAKTHATARRLEVEETQSG